MTAPRGEVGQVDEVADAPRPLGAHGVDLGHEAPLATRGQRRRVQPRRGDDQLARGLAQHPVGPLGPRPHGVPAQGQVPRQPERGLADQDPVDVPGLDPAIHLVQEPGLAALLAVDPHGHRVAVGHVHPALVVRARTHDEHGGQHPAPWRVAPVVEGVPDRIRGADVHLKGAEHSRDGRGPDPVVVAGLVPVLDRDAVGPGQLDQLRARLDPLRLHDRRLRGLRSRLSACGCRARVRRSICTHQGASSRMSVRPRGPRRWARSTVP